MKLYFGSQLQELKYLHFIFVRKPSDCLEINKLESK
jgi:hypothetical protein